MIGSAFALSRIVNVGWTVQKLYGAEPFVFWHTVHGVVCVCASADQRCYVSRIPHPLSHPQCTTSIRDHDYTSLRPPNAPSPPTRPGEVCLTFLKLVKPECTWFWWVGAETDTRLSNLGGWLDKTPLNTFGGGWVRDSLKNASINSFSTASMLALGRRGGRRPSSQLTKACPPNQF